MTVFIIIYISLSALACLYIIMMSKIARKQMTSILSKDLNNIKAPSARALKILSDRDDKGIVRNYIIYNSLIMIYPFAAQWLSVLFSLCQIICIGIIIYCLISAHYILAIMLGILFILAGFSGSRCNNKLMLKEYAKVLAQSSGNVYITQLHPSHYEKELHEFHKSYYYELKREYGK